MKNICLFLIIKNFFYSRYTKLSHIDSGGPSNIIMEEVVRDSTLSTNSDNSNETNGKNAYEQEIKSKIEAFLKQKYNKEFVKRFLLVFPNTIRIASQIDCSPSLITYLKYPEKYKSSEKSAELLWRWLSRNTLDKIKEFLTVEKSYMEIFEQMETLDWSKKAIFYDELAEYHASFIDIKKYHPIPVSKAAKQLREIIESNRYTSIPYTRFNFSHNCLGSNGLVQIVDVLRTCSTEVKSLDINSNEIYDISPLKEILALPSLQYLNICENEVDGKQLDLLLEIFPVEQRTALEDKIEVDC